MKSEYLNRTNAYRGKLSIWANHQSRILKEQGANLTLREASMIGKAKIGRQRLFITSIFIMLLGAFYFLHIRGVRNQEVERHNKILISKNNVISNQLEINALQQRELGNANNQILED